MLNTWTSGSCRALEFNTADGNCSLVFMHLSLMQLRKGGWVIRSYRLEQRPINLKNHGKDCIPNYGIFHLNNLILISLKLKTSESFGMAPLIHETPSKPLIRLHKFHSLKMFCLIYNLCRCKSHLLVRNRCLK